MNKQYAKIIGVGHYLPEKILTNHDLAQQVDTSDEWIRERTGIAQRHIAADDQSCAQLAEFAAREALDKANISAHDIDLIIIATTTADHIYPSAAVMLQARLGNVGAAAFDVNAACSGFIYALAVADNFIRAGSAKRALVVGAEVNSRILDWTDRATCILFGDGAGAVVLEASAEAGILSTHLHADGRYSDLLLVEGGAGNSRADASPYIQMRGNEVFKFAVKTLHHVVEETLAASGMAVSDVDWLVPHQANLRIITATAKKLDLPLEQVILTVDQHANTSSASIPLALYAGIADGRIKAGNTVLLEAFGGGFTWGSALIKM